MKQQSLEVRCQSGPGLGLRLGQQPWIRTRLEIRNFSANSNNYFVFVFFFAYNTWKKSGAWREIWTGSCLRKARRGPLGLDCVGLLGGQPQPQTGQYGCLQTYKRILCRSDTDAASSLDDISGHEVHLPKLVKGTVFNNNAHFSTQTIFFKLDTTWKKRGRLHEKWVQHQFFFEASATL